MLICESHANTLRWQLGERLDSLFEQRCDQLTAAGHLQHIAVAIEDQGFTYFELDERANQLARFLTSTGIQAGDRVAVLFDRSFQTYVALLAILKVNAAYVPLDPGFPVDRIQFILKDAAVKSIVTLSAFRFLLQDDQIKNTGIPLVLIDDAESQVSINQQSKARLTEIEKGSCSDQLCYIIYTSGSTGNPKGVAVEHPSICNFVEVAREVYGITENDRVYQGMTIAFDFSVEELWVPLMAGATLVPSKADSKLIGKELSDFLIENDVTALCCVPTLLATLENELPKLRFLLVSGEACPQDLIQRWYKPGRTFLNAYGPTEATVTCTWTELHPHKPVTIGQPLPTYSVVILKEDSDQVVSKGSLGEICVAGIGLAKGYVNRDDLTERSFIKDFIHITNNPSQRIYRTGDLGRITDTGEIEYHGRIDLQVKIRGYRIELTEVESVLMQHPDVAAVVVDVYETDASKDLVAYYTLKEADAGETTVGETKKVIPKTTEVREQELSELARAQLPSYMVPSFFECLESIPLLPSDKADRKKLPPPSRTRVSVGSGKLVPPQNERQTLLRDVLAEVLGVEPNTVSINDNFFTQLGAHSLLMAKFCSGVRRCSDHSIAMKDVYANPSIVQLDQWLAKQNSTSDSAHTQTRDRVTHTPTRLQYYSCGLLQAGFYVAFSILSYASFIIGWDVLLASTSWFDLAVRSVALSTSLFVGWTGIGIIASRLLVGRWQVQTIPVWSLRYFNFWVVKSLVKSSPMALFKGAPLYNVYLRLFGAKIGRNVVIEAKVVPVGLDLFTVGDNVVIAKDVVMPGYNIQDNLLEVGPVTIGSNVYIGEGSVLDIHTTMEDNTQLGHASALHSYQTISEGKHYQGSIAEETDIEFCRVTSKPCTQLRKVLYSCYQLMTPAVGVFLFFWLISSVAPYFFGQGLEGALLKYLPEISIGTVLALLPISIVLFFGALVMALIYIAVVPRLLNLMLKADKTYVLYGFHYWLSRVVRGSTNSRFFNTLFGDSICITSYLKWVGLDLSKVIQTGSNFGLFQTYDNPFYCKIGSGTMVSDGLMMGNFDLSSTSFQVSRVIVGDQSFIGNNIYYPSGGKTGHNCLLATRCMVPFWGDVSENIGLLGSPVFSIPRATSRDSRIAAIDPSEKEELICQKTKSNLATMRWFLGWRLGFLFLSLLFVHTFLWTMISFGDAMALVSAIGFGLFSIGYFIFVERLSARFKVMKPTVVSIYDKAFWSIEHYWKNSETWMTNLYKGTPFKNVVSRLLGAKVGKVVMDDGMYMSERTLVEVGDYCNINYNSTLQSHSLEEGVFKSGKITIGNGCTIGVNSFIHYDAVIEDRAVMNSDVFLMKGELATAGSVWRGNPAREICCG